LETNLGAPEFQSLAITPNQGTVARFWVHHRHAKADTPVAFNALASYDPDGSIASYDWNFGDGQTLSNGGPTPTHTYERPGLYAVTLTVTDNEGCSDKLVFTGQTVSCNGGAGAIDSREVLIRPTNRR
jgi:PKD repeat protein